MLKKVLRIILYMLAFIVIAALAAALLVGVLVLATNAGAWTGGQEAEVLSWSDLTTHWLTIFVIIVFFSPFIIFGRTSKDTENPNK